MMKRLLLIRHAESEANVQTHLIGGRANHVELTERGIEQAKLLGRYLANVEIVPSVVYRSPAVRTMQTAEYALLAADIHADMYVHDGLQEMSQGIFEGRLRDEIYTAERIAAMNKTGKDAKLPGEGAESMTEVGERMYLTALEIVERLEDGETAIAFGHGLAIKCFASHIENWSREKTFKTETDNTSISEFTFENGEFAVIRVGDTPHMTAKVQ